MATLCIKTCSARFVFWARFGIQVVGEGCTVQGTVRDALLAHRRHPMNAIEAACLA